MHEEGASRLRLEVTAEPPAGWDDFVRADPDGSFCHLEGWKRVFEGALGLEHLFLHARDAGGDPVGALPLTRMPRLGAGTVLVSVPYLNYGGPLGSEEARTALTERAAAMVRDGRDRFVEIRARRRVRSGVPEGRERVTVLLELPEDPDTLFTDHFRSKLRSQIRRPMKEDMETRFGPGELDAFYRVFAENMRDLGTPVLPRRFFEAIAGTFPSLVDFGAVYHEGTPVAAGCGFHWREEFEMTWASSLRAYNRMSPNMLLYWRFMERCIERGRGCFNFGRCSPGGGTHRFKSQWGTEDEPLPWLQWPASENPPEAEEGIFSLASSLWQKLPVPIANRLGPLLARRIPTF